MFLQDSGLILSESLVVLGGVIATELMHGSYKALERKES
jgi:hypothetical protein